MLNIQVILGEERSKRDIGNGRKEKMD